MTAVRKVTGQKDPIMKLVRALHNKDGRTRNGSYVAEGQELLRRAMDFGAAVQFLVVTTPLLDSEEGIDLVHRATSAGIEVVCASSGLLGKMLGAKPIPDCIAIVQRDIVPIEKALGADGSLVLAIEHGENVDNLGMALRSCDAAGVDGVVLAGRTVDPHNRRTVRGSRGAVFSLPISVVAGAEPTIAEAHRLGYQVIGSSASAETQYSDMAYESPTMFIVGNEHSGLSESVRDKCDALVQIPMRGHIHSLNIAVAASILLYEAIRQRNH